MVRSRLGRTPGYERCWRWGAGRWLGCCVLICALGALGAAGTAGAAGSTRYVSSTGVDTDNDCTDAANPCLTVQYALEQANAGDTVAVSGTHDETVRVRVSVTITQWRGKPQGALDGFNTSTGDPVLWVDGIDTNVPPVVTLRGLLIEKAPSNDGILITGGASLTAEHSTISHNADAGIELDSASTVTIENSTIANNAGRGIYDRGTATVLRSTIKGNTAPVGAGIYVDSGGTLLLGDSTLSGNAAANVDGGLLNRGTATVEKSTIAHNSSPGASGIANAKNANVKLAGDILAEQTSGSDCSGVAGIVDDGYNLDDDGSCISRTSPGPGSHNGRAADGSSTYGAVVDAYLANSLAKTAPTKTLPLLNSPSPATTEPDPALAVVPPSFQLPVALNARSAACSVPDQRGITPAAGIRCDVGAYLLQATRTTLARSSGTPHPDRPVTYTATITPAPHRGAVAFFDGPGNPATMHCRARPVTGGQATCTVSYPKPGIFSVTARYSGDGRSNDHAGSTSKPPVTVRVRPHRG